MISKIISAIIGAAVLLAIIYGCESYVAKMYPPPSGSDFENARVLNRLTYQFPRGTFAGLLGVCAVASIIGGLVSTLISGREEIIPAAIAGVLAMVVGIFNPYETLEPTWFTFASLLSLIPFACLGYFIIRRPRVKTVYEADYSV